MYIRQKNTFWLLAFFLLIGITFSLFRLFQSPLPRHVDIGSPDDTPFINNFFLPETDGGTTFRWSDAAASSLRVPGSSNGLMSLSMRLNGDLRMQHAVTGVDLIDTTTVLGRFDLQPGWRVYHVLVPPGVTVETALTPAPLALKASPIVHEQRNLGVPIDWVRYDFVAHSSLPISVPLQRTALFLWSLLGIAVLSWTVDQWFRPYLSNGRILRVGVVCCVYSVGVLTGAWYDPYLLCWYFRTLPVIFGGIVGLLSPYLIRLARWIGADKGEAVPETVFYSSLQTSRFIGWYVVYGIAAICFTVVYFTQTVEYEDATFQALTSFTAFVPYQYRILLPGIVYLLTFFVPTSLYVLYVCATVLSALLVLLTFRLFLAHFIMSDSVNWYCLFILYPMVWNYAFLSIFIYPSDIVAISLFTLGLLSILQRRWRWYYVIFIIATFNRETSCFLAFSFLFVLFNKKPVSYLLAHCSLQFTLWIMIRILLTYLFRNNFGDRIFQNQLLQNYLLVQDFVALEPFALARLGTFGGIWICIPFLWKMQPPILKRLLWVVVPFIIGMSVVGLLHEARIYSELIPILTAPILYSVHYVFRPVLLRFRSL